MMIAPANKAAAKAMTASQMSAGSWTEVRATIQAVVPAVLMAASTTPGPCRDANTNLSDSRAVNYSARPVSARRLFRGETLTTLRPTLLHIEQYTHSVLVPRSVPVFQLMNLL